ncbi:MAG: hypothetical protein OEQ12_06655 [Nitrosopumilus sp.]|nr:hypothetical protein [Nitrosopumilus sp.]
MNDRTMVTILALLTLFTIPFAFDNAFALDSKKFIAVEDLGILQLAAHDLFNVDRCGGDISCSKDFENGKLDLSTLFVDTTNNNKKFNLETIAIGGEPRNRENIMLFTVASELGSTYVKLLGDGVKKNDAKQIVTKMYHDRLANTYQNTFKEPFPDPISGKATLQENLALRTIHDFLPGKIKIDGQKISTLDPILIGKTLDEKELQQKSSKLDGKFDDEFLEIDICFPPDFTICIDVNLLEADRTFGEQFKLELSFDDCLEELKDGKYDENDLVMTHIRNLMAKGQNL